KQLTDALQATTPDAMAAIQQVRTSALHGIEERLRIDLRTLNETEAAVSGRIRHSGAVVRRQLKQGAKRAARELTSAASMAAPSLDNMAIEGAGAVALAERPCLPTVMQIVDAGSASAVDLRRAGETQLDSTTAAGVDMLAQAATAYATQTHALVAQTGHSA